MYHAQWFRKLFQVYCLFYFSAVNGFESFAKCICLNSGSAASGRDVRDVPAVKMPQSPHTALGVTPYLCGANINHQAEMNYGVLRSSKNLKRQGIGAENTQLTPQKRAQSIKGLLDCSKQRKSRKKAILKTKGYFWMVWSQALLADNVAAPPSIRQAEEKQVSRFPDR